MTEPIRVRIYTVLSILIALLVSKGIVQSSEMDLYIALAAAVLGVGGVESARKSVTPNVKLVGSREDPPFAP